MHDVFILKQKLVQGLSIKTKIAIIFNLHTINTLKNLGTVLKTQAISMQKVSSFTNLENKQYQMHRLYQNIFLSI